MTKLIKNHIIFSFDQPWQIHVAAKLYRFIDTLRAMDKLQYTPKLGTGYWEGTLEPIIMMDYNDFVERIVDSGYVDDQECFLQLNPRTPRSSATQATLVYNTPDKNGKVLGEFKEITYNEALLSNAWTCLDKRYYVAGGR
jgi:hypothetical protein